MSYQIVYGAVENQNKGIRSARVRLLIAGSFLIFAWAVRLFWPEGREVLAAHLLPGDPTLAQTAFSALLENLRSGDRVVESLTVFCREILHEIV